MNLFHFFSPKKKTVSPPAVVAAKRYECNINNTGVVATLFKIPREQRDGQWYNAFYKHVGTASFACGRPQTLIGPDGFTYFILRTPEEAQPFESFCIQNMKDDFLLERGWGVVFNPTASGTADWVFTHGNILNLHLTGQFFSVPEESDTQNIDFVKTVGVLKKEEQVMIAQPSEAYLPKATRKALRHFLQSKGIKAPMVMMLSSYSGGKTLRKLALNIPPENYPVTSQLDHLMQQVGWFLPNDYLLVPLSKTSALAKDFYPL